VADIPFRIVLDTNTLLRGLVAGAGAARTVRQAAERRRFIPLLSKPVLDEYRAVLSDKVLVERFPELTPELVEITIRRLRYVGDYIRTPAIRFEFPRGARDERFIELAIALRATHLVSFDEDLLSLPRSQTERESDSDNECPKPKCWVLLNSLGNMRRCWDYSKNRQSQSAP